MSAGTDRRFGGDCRLRKTDEYSSVFAFRRSHASTHFQLHYGPRRDGQARLGLVVGRKQARSAVLRNLVKRLAREAFRAHRAALPACDLVVRLRVALDRPQRAVLRTEIDALLARVSK